MEATAEKNKTVRQTKNALRPASFMKPKLLTTLAINIKNIQVQLNLHLRKGISYHTRDFKYKKYVKCTEFSKYLKNCPKGQLFIIKSLDDCNLLSKGSELISKYRHQTKLLLSNVKRIDVCSCILCLYLIFSFCLYLYKIQKICIGIMPDEVKSMKL